MDKFDDMLTFLKNGGSALRIDVLNNEIKIIGGDDLATTSNNQKYLQFGINDLIKIENGTIDAIQIIEFLTNRLTSLLLEQRRQKLRR